MQLNRKNVALVGMALSVFSPLMLPAAAGSAENGRVVVTCSEPGVVVKCSGSDFEVLALGYSDSFVADVMVEAKEGWRLIEPSEEKLPLRMGSGDSAPYGVVREPEDADSGKIMFHCYCICSNRDSGAKDIIVASGENVTYTAYMDGARSASDWIVNEETKKDTSQIVFNRNWWNVPGWFFPSVDTPKPGVYSIVAQDARNADLHDSGTMTVAGLKKIAGPNGKSSERGGLPKSGTTWLENEVVYAQPRSLFNLTAELEPGLMADEVDKIKSSIKWSASSGRIAQDAGNPLVSEYCAPDDEGTYEIEASCGETRRIILVKVGVLRIHKVSFVDNISVLRDDTGTAYSNPAWLDDDLDGMSDLPGANANASKRYQPIAYLSTKKMSATSTFLPFCTKVTNPAEFISDFDATAAVQKIRFAPNNRLFGWDWSTPVSLNKSGTTVTASNPFRDHAEVGYEKEYELAWEVGFGKSEMSDNSLSWHRSYSQHELYLTYKAEEESYETVFHISCKNATGRDADLSVIEGVWRGFSGRNVTRKDGALMTYYKSYSNKVTTVPQLLKYTDGQCSAWVDLFGETLRIQGISFSRAWVVPIGAAGFLVNSWSFGEIATSGNSYFPYMNEWGNENSYMNETSYDWGDVAEVIYVSGTPGQNNPKPAALFGNHQIIVAPEHGSLYDPSYGIKYNSTQEIDDKLSGFVIFGEGEKKAFFIKKNPAGIQISVILPK